jgi:hypothetical protein
MSISDGQKVNAANSNTAWMSRTSDDNTVGKKDLQNTDPASGSDILNIQKEHNSIASFAGKATNTIENAKPTYSSDAVGVANEDLEARAGALTVRADSNTTAIVANTSDIADVRTTQGTADGDVDMGTYVAGTNGFNLTAAQNSKVNNQELIAGVDARILLTEKAAINGVATLDGAGRIPNSQLPISAVEYLGAYNATTNTPTLIDGVGTAGDTYDVTVAGTQDLGSGAITFDIGDSIRYTGSVWIKLDQVDQVTLANAVTLTNKTIDANNNTITNLAHGAEVDNPASGVHGVVGSIVGTTDTQTMTNKTFDDEVTVQEIATPATPATGYMAIYPKTDKKFYSLDDTGLEQELGSGGGSGQGGINYIINTDAEIDLTGVTDTVNVTTTLSGVSPIRDTQSFNSVYSSSATVADYTQWAMNDVDLVDLGKELIISFEYSADAGVSTGDFEVVVRNLDSAVDITILDADLSYTGGHGSPTKFVGKFQTDATDNTYALRIRPTFSFGTARTLKVDNIQVGPDKLLPGAIITEWQSFVPTGAWTTNTTYTGQWRRVGDSMEIQYTASTSGAPNAANFYFDMIPGYTIDTAKLSTNAPSAFTVGHGSVLNGGVLVWSATGSISANKFFMYAGTTGGADALITQVSPFAYGASDAITFIAKVPIVGWAASNLISTQENLFSTVTTKANRATSTQNLTAGVFTKILFNAKSIDKFNNFDTTLGRFTASKSGNYSVTSGLSYNGPAANQVVDVVLRKNGTAISWARSQAIGGVSGGTNDTFQIDLIKGDYIEIWVACPQVLGILSSATINGGSFMTVQELPDFSVFGVTGETEIQEIQAQPFQVLSLTGGVYADITSFTLAPGKHKIEIDVGHRTQGAAPGGPFDLTTHLHTVAGNAADAIAYGKNAGLSVNANATWINMKTRFKQTVVLTSETTFYLKHLTGITLTASALRLDYYNIFTERVN